MLVGEASSIGLHHMHRIENTFVQSDCITFKCVCKFIVWHLRCLKNSIVFCVRHEAVKWKFLHVNIMLLVRVTLVLR